MQKSIIFVTGAMCRGGAERVISLLANDYVKRGWSVTIAMLLHSDTDGYYLDPDIRIADLSQKGVHPALAIHLLVGRFRKLVRECQPEAVVSFMAQITLISGLACFGLPIRLIASERIDPSMVHRNWLFRSTLNRIYATCVCTILQTKRAWSYFPERVQNNSVIIPNPIQVACTADEVWRKRIVTAGRLEEQKNHAMLIDAFSEFLKEFPDYVLDIYGEGTKRTELDEQIRRLGLQNCVRLMGSSNQLHQDICDAAMFALSSDFEGLSNALLEAMMMGLPVISTDCAGADEAIQEGENGLLVPIRNTEAMAEAMKKMASDESRMRCMGKQARKDALERYHVDQVIRLWRDVIETKRTRPVDSGGNP